MSAVLDDAARARLAQTRRDFEAATMLPGECFASPAVLALEHEVLFGRAWHCVARAEDLPDAGSFRRVHVGGESVLIVRDAQGGLGAFYNVCLHRGSQLVDASRGRVEQIRCPYHAWCYDLHGRLTHVPRQHAAAPAPVATDRALRPVRLAQWGGYLLVNLDDDAPSLAEAWADLPDLSAYEMSSLRCAHRETYEVAANWKLICQNYSECYHCPGSHPQLSRISDYLEDHGTTGVFEGVCYNGGPMRLREGFSTMSMSGRERLPARPGLDARERRLVHYYLVYPSLLLSPHPDYVLVHRLVPLAADRTRVECEWLVAPEALADAEGVADVVDFWHLTNRQDWQLCERNHRGVVSRAYTPGPYHPSERCVHAFDRWYADRLTAALAALD